mmetsp:Transcript_162197/g.520174  ORF Transcript_162197/g.520174 Transcript_162197/m.520174 type:complete len:490 (+) Transcript_162197:379-1848(+)
MLGHRLARGRAVLRCSRHREASAAVHGRCACSSHVHVLRQAGRRAAHAPRGAEWRGRGAPDPRGIPGRPQRGGEARRPGALLPLARGILLYVGRRDALPVGERRGHRPPEPALDDAVARRGAHRRRGRGRALGGVRSEQGAAGQAGEDRLEGCGGGWRVPASEIARAGKLVHCRRRHSGRALPERYRRVPPWAISGELGQRVQGPDRCFVRRGLWREEGEWALVPDCYPVRQATIPDAELGGYDIVEPGQEAVEDGQGGRRLHQDIVCLGRGHRCGARCRLGGSGRQGGASVYHSRRVRIHGGSLDRAHATGTRRGGRALGDLDHRPHRGKCLPSCIADAGSDFRHELRLQDGEDLEVQHRDPWGSPAEPQEMATVARTIGTAAQNQRGKEASVAIQRCCNQRHLRHFQRHGQRGARNGAQVGSQDECDPGSHTVVADAGCRLRGGPPDIGRDGAPWHLPEPGRTGDPEVHLGELRQALSHSPAHPPLH